MKKFLMTVLILTFVFTLAACGARSSFGVDYDSSRITATAKNADAESSGTGYLSLESDMTLTITGDMEEGIIEVRVYPLTEVLEAEESTLSDENASPEEVLQAVTGDDISVIMKEEPLAFARIERQDQMTCDIRAGEYVVVCSVPEKGATGTVTIEAK